ncbi:MAG: hypothetical protein EOO88_25700 [Pedobacter sp.]|nr:MAG: hypothetical protein EOO88_25700 [Pedobacter sp.]
MFAFLFCCLLKVEAFSQKIALLNKDLKSPILYTDSVTVEQVSSGRFAVSVEDLDTLVASLAYLNGQLQERSRSKMESWQFRSGKTTINISRIPKAYGDQYEIIATSLFDEISSRYNLSTEKNNKKNAEKIQRVLAYIEKNRTVLREWYEIKRKMYQVVVVRE